MPYTTDSYSGWLGSGQDVNEPYVYASGTQGPAAPSQALNNNNQSFWQSLTGGLFNSSNEPKANNNSNSSSGNNSGGGGGSSFNLGLNLDATSALQALFTNDVGIANANANGYIGAAQVQSQASIEKAKQQSKTIMIIAIAGGVVITTVLIVVAFIFKGKK